MNRFDEMLCRYNVLTEDAKKTDKICYRIFKGNRRYTLESDEKNTNAMIMIQVSSASSLQIYLGGIKIYDYAGIKNAYVPVIVNQRKELRIIGDCEYLVVVALGASFVEKERNFYLDRINTYIEDCGEFRIQEYASLADYVCYNFNTVKILEDVIEAKVINYNGNEYCGVIFKDNDGVCFSSSIDNYVGKIIITNDCDDIVVLGSTSHDKLYFVYLIFGEIYRATYDISSGVLSGAVLIDIDAKIDNGSVVGFIKTQINSDENVFVCINISNKYMVVYDINNNIIVNNYKIYDKNVNTIINNNEILIFQKLYKKMQIIKIIYVYNNN